MAKTVEENNCGWRVDDRKEEIARGIEEAAEEKEERIEEMKRNALRLVREKYDWKIIAEEVVRNYNAVIGR